MRSKLYLSQELGDNYTFYIHNNNNNNNNNINYENVKASGTKDRTRKERY